MQVRVPRMSPNMKNEEKTMKWRFFQKVAYSIDLLWFVQGFYVI